MLQINKTHDYTLHGLKMQELANRPTHKQLGAGVLEPLNHFVLFV